MNDDLSEVARRFLEYLARREAEGAGEVCPRCADRSIDPKSPFGWCKPCTRERRQEEEAKLERERVRKATWWRANGAAWRAGELKRRS